MARIFVHCPRVVPVRCVARTSPLAGVRHSEKFVVRRLAGRAGAGPLGPLKAT
jgi:hypothetical protein